jgi:alpha-amylase
MSKISFGFQVHQPFRLASTFDYVEFLTRRDRREEYFGENNREILEQVTQNCYLPATEIMLENLDGGFKCAFSFSGTVLEQLERWGKDALELFTQVAVHKNAEILAETYHHSLASLFHDKDEFKEQIRLHLKLMKDTFRVRPKVFANTEFIFNNEIAALVPKLGFSAVYAEGVDHVLKGRSPNDLYTCQGIKVLTRNYQLSDDIAFKFGNREWMQYPLTADKYASWIAATPGDCINIFLAYETFGEHWGKDSGILDFLRWLPSELMEKENECVLPSQAALMAPREELDIEKTISWAGMEKDLSTWLGNCQQRIAFKELERAQALVKNKEIWRYLQTSDHFLYMSEKVSPAPPYYGGGGPLESFATYMRILSDLEQYAGMKKIKGPFMGLLCLPPEKAFHFYSDDKNAGFSAYSMDEFAEQLQIVPDDVITYHLERGDFSSWIENVIGDPQLAASIRKCTTRHELVELVEKRRDYLYTRL